MEELVQENKKLKAEVEELKKQLQIPPMVTRLTAAERVKLFQRINKRVVNGKWTGQTRLGRPIIAMVTSDDKSRGAVIKKAGYKKQLYLCHRATKFQVTHLILLQKGDEPTHVLCVASHLCHEKTCIDPNHLEWSTSSNNLKREKCRQRQICCCGLPKKCILNEKH